MRVFAKLAALAASTALVVACGGGGSGGAPTLQKGVFIDSPVEGLGYLTTSQAGATNQKGEFTYLSGENVTFTLYGQTLFSPKGFSYLTPFDLSDTSVDPAYSINLVRFFLTVDEDQDPSNGIKLPAFAGPFGVNFNQSLLSFETDTTGELTSALTSIAAGRALPSIPDALAHFNESMAKVSPNYSLNLVGRTATSVTKNSFCSNDVTSSWRYEFGSTQVKMVGSDEFITDSSAADPRFCTVGPQETINEIYSGAFQKGEAFDCFPNCEYKDLNRVSYVPSDFDGRTAVEWTWHTPGSNTIWYVKTILANPNFNNNPASLSTFIEIITLDTTTATDAPD
jgi:hypothetical protein